MNNLVEETTQRTNPCLFLLLPKTEVTSIKKPARPLTTVKTIPWTSLPNLAGKNPTMKPRPRVQQRTKLFLITLTSLSDNG